MPEDRRGRCAVVNTPPCADRVRYGEEHPRMKDYRFVIGLLTGTFAGAGAK